MVFISFFLIKKSLSLHLSVLCLFGVIVDMSPMDLMIYFREEKHKVGFIHPNDYTVDRIMIEALQITGVYKLSKAGKILLNVINPKNKSKLC